MDPFGAICPHGRQSLPSPTLTLSGCKHEGTTASSGLNSVVWLVITHKPWGLTLYTDSWAVLKELTLWLGSGEANGWMIMNKPLCPPVNLLMFLSGGGKF